VAHDVARLDRAAAANMLLATVFAYTLARSSLARGRSTGAHRTVAHDRLQIGLSMALASFAGICLDVHTGRLAIILVYGFSVISAALAYALLAPRFPLEMTGRVVTRFEPANVRRFVRLPVGHRAVLKQYPVWTGTTRRRVIRLPWARSRWRRSSCWRGCGR